MSSDHCLRRGPQFGRIATKSFDLLGDGLLHFRHDDFSSADEDSFKLCGLWIDRHWQDRVGTLSRKYIENTLAWFEPRITPGVQHCLSLFLIETGINQHSDELAAERGRG